MRNAELTDEQIVATIEKSSEARLGISGLVRDLVILASLLDESHPLHVTP